MTLPATGSAISLSQIQSEFGGSNPISLTEYYAGGSNVPPGTGTIQSSSTINMNRFHGQHHAILYYRGAASVTTVGSDTVIKFTSSGQLRADFGTLATRALIIGGGGGGGSAGGGRSGGGGSGGAVDTTINLTSGLDYVVSIASSCAADTDGNTTSLGSLLIATGGTKGTGSGDYGRYAVAGNSGYVTYNGGTVNGVHYGGNYNSSGQYETGSGWGAGGGGGAGGQGVNGYALGQTAYGGAGISSDITGTATSYASGGSGGSACGYTAGTAGGGGWAGGYQGGAGAGADGTGGGGGGTCQGSGAGGGSGLFIIRGKFQAINY